MKEKLIFFLIFIAIAAFMIVGASESKSIICSNVNKTCYTKIENFITKTSKETAMVNLNSMRNPQTTISLGDESRISLRCRSHTYKTHTKSNGNTVTKNVTKYQLLPFSQRASRYNTTVINEYTNLSACNQDKKMFERYFNSDETSDLVYKLPTGLTPILMYLGAILLILFGFAILFVGKVVNPNELQGTTLTEEEQQKRAAEMMQKMEKTMQFFNKFMK